MYHKGLTPITAVRYFFPLWTLYFTGNGLVLVSPLCLVRTSATDPFLTTSLLCLHVHRYLSPRLIMVSEVFQHQAPIQRSPFLVPISINMRCGGAKQRGKGFTSCMRTTDPARPVLPFRLQILQPYTTSLCLHQSTHHKHPLHLASVSAKLQPLVYKVQTCPTSDTPLMVLSTARPCDLSRPLQHIQKVAHPDTHLPRRLPKPIIPSFTTVEVIIARTPFIFRDPKPMRRLRSYSRTSNVPALKANYPICPSNRSGIWCIATNIYDGRRKEQEKNSLGDRRRRGSRRRSYLTRQSGTSRSFLTGPSHQSKQAACKFR